MLTSPDRVTTHDSRFTRILCRIADFALGAVFIYAGALKALDPVAFANDIDNYKIVPWPFVVALALYLPWVEIFCGLAAVLRRCYAGGLSVLVALLGVFLAATIAAKLRGLDITCGCFGHSTQHWSFSTHLAVDLFLLALGVVLLGIRWRAAVPPRSATA